MVVLFPFAFLLIGYFLGSFPTAYIVVRYTTGKDIRNEETGNVGAMNTARTTGKFQLFILVVLIDAAKGFLGVFLPTLISAHGYDLVLAMTLGAFGVVLGHCYSIYFKIKDGKFAGGKAVASLGGILIGVSFYKLFLPWGIVMLVPALLGNFLIAQFAGTVALPLIGFFLIPEYFLMTVLCAIPIFIKQWPRVIPALKGKEPKWYFRSHSKKRSDKVI